MKSDDIFAKIIVWLFVLFTCGTALLIVSLILGWLTLGTLEVWEAVVS